MFWRSRGQRLLFFLPMTNDPRTIFSLIPLMVLPLIGVNVSHFESAHFSYFPVFSPMYRSQNLYIRSEISYQMVRLTDKSSWIHSNCNLTNFLALQTPKQRAANAKWSKKIHNQHGKPKSTKSEFKFPVSKFWVVMLVFLVCGGAVLELLRMFF